MDRISHNLEQLVGFERNQIEKHSVELASEVHSVRNLVLAFLLTGIIAGIAIAWLLTYMVTCPIQLAADAMKDIAEGDGDLTHRLQVKNNDELGQLAGAFNTFIEKIHALISQVAGSTRAFGYSPEGHFIAIVFDTKSLHHKSPTPMAAVESGFETTFGRR